MTKQRRRARRRRGQRRARAVEAGSPPPHTGEARRARPSIRLVVAGAVALAVAGGILGTTAYLGQDPLFSTAVSEPPRARILREEQELGEMAVTEERTASFLVVNAGGRALELSEVRTSCMCALAEVVIEGEKSPTFSMKMHNSASAQAWKGVLAPGRTATVLLTYKPSLMPVQGSVARNVKIATNDPERPVVELGIHAFVR